jgi:Protein of unknown function (DUF4235)
MANAVDRLGWRLTTIAVGIPVGIATKKIIEKAWAAARPGDPPRAPRDPDATWGDALGWAALSALGVAIAQLVTTKSAASVWRKLVGAEPPVKAIEPAAPAEAEQPAT